MMKKLLAVICTLAILATAVPAVFAAEDDVIVPLSDFQSVEPGKELQHADYFYNGWKRQGSSESGVIAQEANRNKYVKLITAATYNELVNDFSAIDDSVVKSIRVSGKTIFHDNYLRRGVIFRGSSESNYMYFNTDRTVTVGDKIMDKFTYADDVWYDFTIDFNPISGYIVFAITDTDGTVYTCSGYGAANNTGLWRLDFITPPGSTAAPSEWGIDDVEIIKIPEIKEPISTENIIESNFQNVEADTAFTTSATAGWKFAANGGTGSSATVVTKDGNNFVRYIPGTSVAEFYNDFASNGNYRYVNCVNYSFRTMFEGKSERKIMFRASGELYYVTFTNGGKVMAGSNVVRGFTYEENKWYDVSINFNPVNGYVNVTVSDGLNSYKAQGYGSAQTSGLWRVNFVQPSGSGTAWNIDDVKLREIDPVSEYEETIVLIDNETFSGFTPNQELTGTLTNGWKAVGNAEKGTSVKVINEDGNQYVNITAGAEHYTEFYHEFAAMNDTNSGYKLNFSINIADANNDKTIFLRGNGGETSYIFFEKDKRVYVGQSNNESNQIPNFTYELNTWYDFEAVFNPASGQIYLSVKDGDNTYGAWGIGNANSGLWRLNFVVDPDLTEGTTSYSIDNVSLEQTAAASWNYYDISDISYSADALSAGEITASVSGQIYGKNVLNLFLASYSKETKKMVEIDVIPIKPEGFGKDFTARVTLPSDYENYEVRAFLFDGSLVPVKTVPALR